MKRSSHLTIGIILTYFLYTLNYGWLYCLIGLQGSIAPDIDLKIGLRHRTITHSIIALILTTMPLYLFSHQLGIVWFINYLSHLIADSMTKMGVPYFYPYKHYYGLKLFSTGSLWEHVFILISIGLFLIYILNKYAYLQF